MKSLESFKDSKNKISYTLQKAYEMGFSNPDVNNKKKPLSILNKIKKSVTSKAYNDKIIYAEMPVNFIDVIPNLYKNNNSIFDTFQPYFLFDNDIYCNSLLSFLVNNFTEKKIIFIHLSITGYFIDREEESNYSTHGTCMIFVPNKDLYEAYYINSHGHDMTFTNSYSVMLSRSRTKLYKFNEPVDFVFMEKLVSFINEKSDFNVRYTKTNDHNYYGSNLQSGDNHGICFIFAYVIYYNLCKYFTKKKELSGIRPRSFKSLLLNGEIDIMVHSCFMDHVKDVDIYDDADIIDDVLVRMDYRFIKNVTNSFIRFANQKYFQ